MSAVNQFVFILIGLCILGCILVLLKRDVLSVKYSLLWLLCGCGLLLIAVFPYIIYVIRDIFDMVMPSNVVFMILIGFILLLLLSHSVAVTELSHKSKRQTQAIALLEKRVRELEEQLSQDTHKEP